MPLQGYQDWERVSFQSGFNLLSIEVAITANRANGAFNTEAWSNLLVSLFAPGGADFYQVQFVWYADQAATIQLGQNSVVVGPNSILQLDVPVQGPWLWIFVNVKAGGNATVVNFTFYAQVAAASSFDMNTFSTPLINGQSSVAISGTTDYIASNVYYGNAFLFARAATVNPVSILVMAYDWASGAFVNLMFWGNITNNINVQANIGCVAAPMKIRVTNGAVAAQVIAAILIATQ